MLHSNNEIMCYFILFSIYTSIILIIDNNIIFIFYNITIIIITYNIITLEYKFRNANINNFYISDYVLRIYNTFDTIIKKSYEIINNIKNLYKCDYILRIYNIFKIIIKKSYDIIVLIILSEIIKDFEDLYKTDYIFSIYNAFKIIIIIKKLYEIIELYKKK